MLGATNSYTLKQTKETSSYSQDQVTWTRFTLTLETTKNKQNQFKKTPIYETMIFKILNIR